MKNRKNIYVAMGIAIVIAMFSLLERGNGGGMENKIFYSRFQDVPNEIWDTLKNKRIYFGHQSVGNNIMKGITDIIRENPVVKLSIMETNNASDFEKPIFAHSKVGKNENPTSKMNAFSEIFQSGVGEKLDIAFLKFCFVDIDTKTDLKKLFNEYKATMDRLKKTYPKVKLIYITVPLLKQNEISIKRIVKNLFGNNDLFHEDNNIARNEFNQMIVNEYKATAHVFDLAMIEAKGSNGTMTTFKKNGKTYFALAKEYTNDGGHLNEFGRKKIAEELLLFLANVQ